MITVIHSSVNVGYELCTEKESYIAITRKFDCGF